MSNFKSNFKSLINSRRSTRKFVDKPIDDRDFELIMKAGLLAPTSKNCKSWEFVVVIDKKMLQQLSVCKNSGSSFLAECALAIVVLGNTTITDIWVEDAAIAATYMQLQAEDLDIGSCWCHIRNRMRGEAPAEQSVRDLLEIPDHFGVLCIIGFGHKIEPNEPKEFLQQQWGKVRFGRF